MSDKADQTRERLAEQDPELPRALLTFRPLYGAAGVLLGVTNAETGENLGDFQLTPAQARGSARSLELMAKINEEEQA